MGTRNADRETLSIAYEQQHGFPYVAERTSGLGGAGARRAGDRAFMSDNGGYAIYYILLIVLVASSLIGMRLPLGKALKMVLAWVAIFGVAFVLFSFRSEFSSIGQ